MALQSDFIYQKRKRLMQRWLFWSGNLERPYLLLLTLLGVLLLNFSAGGHHIPFTGF